MGEDFSRKPLTTKTAPMKKVWIDVDKQLKIEAQAVSQGITLKSAERWSKFWKYVKMGISFVFFFFLFKA